MPQRRLPSGRFAKVTQLPDALGKPFKKSGGGYVLMRTNVRAVKPALEELRRTTTESIHDPEKRAAAIQARMQSAALSAYSKTGTGRFARGIHAKVERFSKGDVEGSAIIVTATNYRESRFLTNIGGSGYFKDFPVGPYRIYAKGAEGFDTTVNSLTGRVTKKAGRAAAALAKSAGAGRLKVPRSTAFFTASRKPGRGGGESRQINDILGPADPGDSLGAFFYYPLWVNHPGFPRDVISEVAHEEGALYQEEVLRAVSTDVGQWSKGHGDVVTKDMVVSRIIPLPGLSVTKTGDSDLIAFARGVRRKVPYVPINKTIFS